MGTVTIIPCPHYSRPASNDDLPLLHPGTTQGTPDDEDEGERRNNFGGEPCSVVAIGRKEGANDWLCRDKDEEGVLPFFVSGPEVTERARLVFRVSQLPASSMIVVEVAVAENGAENGDCPHYPFVAP
jgi:hypothetical protein